MIEELIIEHAKYIGRPKPLRCQFSPFLNTIIGGRGSGKSTLLEFMRFVLRRESEVPESLKDESDKYFNTGGDNLLTDESKLSLIYRKGDTRYRLNWTARADIPSLEQEENGEWVVSEGEIQSLFPVYIYSQKQIFELAKNPQALMGIIDSDPKVGAEKIRGTKEELEYKYKRNTQEIQELQRKISQQGNCKEN